MFSFKFFRQGLKSFKTIGSVTSSSSYLCKAMVESCGIEKAKVILELGAGDGVITKHILDTVPFDAKVIAFETNEVFCDMMRKIDDDRLIVVQDSAENLVDHLSKMDISQVDGVISAIPFAIIPERLVRNILNQCKKVMKPHSTYVQVHYAPTQKKRYREVFGNIKMSFVFGNIPPAFVYHSKKIPAQKLHSKVKVATNTA